MPASPSDFGSTLFLETLRLTLKAESLLNRGSGCADPDGGAEKTDWSAVAEGREGAPPRIGSERPALRAGSEMTALRALRDQMETLLTAMDG